MIAKAPPPDFEYPEGDLESVADLFAYRAWIMALFGPHLCGRLLEIGAGIGTFSRDFRALPAVTQMTLVEPSKRQSDILKKTFEGADNVAIHGEAIERALAEIPAASVDTIVMINVLEHIEDDAAVVHALHEKLVRGGKLLIFVPALPLLYGAIDRKVGHWRRYTRSTLRACFAKAEYDISTLHYFDLLGVLPWLVMNRLLGRSNIDRRMARLYDRLGVPLTRGFEALVAPPIGKNLVLVAVKR